MTAKITTTLKPCPFCGSSANLEKYTNQIDKRTNQEIPPWFAVMCPNCACYLGDFSEPSEAVRFWNKRILN